MKNKINTKKNTKKRTAYKRNLLYLFILSIFLVTSFWILIFSNLTQIKEIKVETTCSNLSHNQILQSSQLYLKEKYFYFLPKNNIILLNKKNLDDYFKKENKLIKESNIDKKFPGEIKIKLICQENFFVWNNTTKIFLVNNDGIIFAEIMESEKNKYKENTVEIISNSSRFFQLRESVFSSGEAMFLRDISEKLESLLKTKFKKELKLPILAAKELTLENEQGWKIIFDISQPMEKSLKIIQALFDNDFKDKEIKDLDYINLKIPGKVIYKFKSLTIENEGSETKNEERKDLEIKEKKD